MAKILIVDDSALARNILRMHVGNGKHEVVGLAGDGEQALKLFKSLRPELVLLDYLMADKSGIEVLEEMLEHDPGARVIMVSGSGDHTIEEKALQTGVKLFLEKPCTQKNILKAIEQVMET